MQGWLRRLTSLAAAGGWLLLAAGCGSTSGSGPVPKPSAGVAKPAATRITVFAPTGFKAAATVAGYCWVGSVAAPRAGAYRCMAGNAIHDPCFAGPAKGEVACPEGDPAARRGTLIHLTRALPAAIGAKPDPAHPWSFRLAGGGACGAMTGTVMPGHPYGCGRPQVFCAAPSKGGTGYTVSCAPISKRRAASGAPRLGRSKVYRVAAMWL